MPYVNESKREAIKNNLRTGITAIGDVNYVYTLYIIERWTAKPQYATILDLKTIMYEGYRPVEIQTLDRIVASRGWDVQEVMASKKAAYDEFYLRVARFYEMEKAHENGDVYDGVPYATTIGKPKRIRRSPLSGGE